MGADPSLSPELIEAQAFTSGFRGYDQSEVRSFLGRVSAEVRALRDQADRLESAWHSAEERAARPPVLDEDTLMAAVGEETASILRAARSAANDLRTRAAQEAERILAEAEARSTELRAEAASALDRETKTAQEAAARVVESAQSEAAEMVDKARTDADAIRVAAQHEKALTVEGAISTRERILEDLSRRRRVASVQIEQLRAGRERLLESYGVVRRTLEEVNDELNRADAEARAAADEVGRRMQQARHPDPDPAARASDAGDDRGAAGPDENPADVREGTDAAPDDVAGSAAPPPEPDDAGPATEPLAAPSVAPPVTSSSGGPRGGGKRRDRGSGAGAAEALATVADHAPDATTPTEAAVPHLRIVPDPQDRPAGGPERDPAGGPERDRAGAVGDHAAVPGSQVDVLFARIRAGRTDKTDEPAPAGTEVAAAPVVTADVDRAQTEAAPAVEPPSADGDESLLQRRETAVLDLESSLTRKLKRALQDEQNDLLDRLRSLRGEPTARRLLPELDDQVARYASAAQPLVDRAAAAGVAFAVEILARPGRAHASAPVVADLATEAAATIAESLRRRLEQAVSAAAGDEQAVLIEGVGAAYREWKSERIERIAGDVLAAAFSRGTWHEAPDGTRLRWIVEDSGGPCPDCDDDALAGNLPKGEPFPTGQPYPPAHTGCRCLLVPIRE